MIRTIFHFFKSLIFTSILAGGILTVMAPYGTQALSLIPRTAYWIGFCISGGLGAVSVDYYIRKHRPELSLVQKAFWQSLGATLTVSVLLLGLIQILNGTIPLSYYSLIPVKIWIISFLICGIDLSIKRNMKSAHQNSIPSLLSKLKPELQSADIYALSSEDHYVRVHTSNGDDLIYMRLKDAITEIFPLPGLSPHRSWWVAKDGFNEITRNNGKHQIILKNNRAAPVSRSKLSSLNKAGWL